jgi:hypothetical protein
MENSTTTANYWNGESVLIGAFTDEGLPILLPPADLEEPAPSWSAHRKNITAAELDEKCNEAEAGK